MTVRLARAPSLAAFSRLLDRIDATRAPLHPLLLRAWIALFGPSEAACRSLSAAFGVATVALVSRIGAACFDPRAGLGAAWLAAVGPPLVQYSRETRMYSLLVLLTCCAWACLLAGGKESGRGRWIGYGSTLVAMGYTHPLGLLLIAPLAWTALAFRPVSGLSPRRWIGVHTGVGLALAPWIGRYLDHPPEFFDPAWLRPRYLLGLPIGFIGGDARVLAVGLAIIAFGSFERVDGRLRLATPAASGALLLWLVAPPVLLYGYSLAAHPVFGPARYTLAVAPAYLLLVARGLARAPGLLAWPLVAAGAFVSASALGATVFAADLKADWRSAAAFLAEQGSGGRLLVFSADPRRNVEVETARYYLEPRGWTAAAGEGMALEGHAPDHVWISINVRDGRAAVVPPADLVRAYPEVRGHDLPGLRLERRSR